MNRIDKYKIFVRYAISTGVVSSQRDLGKKMGYTNESAFSQVINGKQKEPKDFIAKLVALFPDLNPEWFDGGGEMLKSEKKGIPLYDTQTIGGYNREVANGEPAKVVEWIDGGDWFPKATAAIHHYGDSMIEYPSGCILALKRVADRRLIINGRNYVIETDEFRITKQVSYDGGEYMMAYSTNTAKHPDGSLIHSPMKIPVETIRHMDLVIGYVVKELNDTPVPLKEK